MMKWFVFVGLIVAACAEGPVGEAVQEVCTVVPGEDCTIPLPIQWTGNGVTCVYSGGQQANSEEIARLHGEDYTAIAEPGPGLGTGSKTMRCNGGCLEVVSESCSR